MTGNEKKITVTAAGSLAALAATAEKHIASELALITKRSLFDFDSYRSAASRVRVDRNAFLCGLHANNEAAKPLAQELIGDLMPDKSKHDAREYCARVLLHVWNTGAHGGKRKSADYVFITAKRGASLYADIHHARSLKDKWGLATGGIMERAAELHATQGGGKHKKSDGMERPETMREAAKKSRADERKKMGAEGKRRGGRKR